MVQKRLETKQKDYKLNLNNIFRGLVFCSECNYRLAYQWSTSKTIKGTYRCLAHIRCRSSDNSICKTSHYITLEQLTKTVLSDVQLNVRLLAEDRAKYAKHLRKLSERTAKPPFVSRSRKR